MRVIHRANQWFAFPDMWSLGPGWTGLRTWRRTSVEPLSARQSPPYRRANRVSTALVLWPCAQGVTTFTATRGWEVPASAPQLCKETVMLEVLDVMTRLGEVKNKTAAALRATEADDAASVVTVAVVREFDSKADKANGQPGPNVSARDSVIELEQAGDSAKAAAEA